MTILKQQYCIGMIHVYNPYTTLAMIYRR